MAIRNWHPGQLAVIWAAGLLAEWVIYELAEYDEGYESIPLVDFVLIAVPVVLLVISWRWFGARQKKEHE